MSDIKELKDDELGQVRGGSYIFVPDCAEFSLNPARDMSDKKMDYTYHCYDCLNWQGPEGPCKLNLVCTTTKNKYE